MTNIHELKESEYADFISLWQEAFSDREDEINDFTSSFGDELKRFTLTDSSEKAFSALTLFKMGELVIPKKKHNKDVYVSYAICTSKLARGKGYGAAITNYAADFVNKNASNWCGNEGLSTLSPASDSLINFYKPLGYSPLFLSHNGKIKINTAGNPSKKIRIKMISSDEYNKKREQILAGTIHVSLSVNSLNYLAGYSEFYSFKLTSLGPEGVFITSAPVEDSKLSLDELLISSHSPSEDIETLNVISKDYDLAAESVADYFGTSICIYNSPAFSKNEHVQAMLFIDNNVAKLLQDAESFYQPYFAFPFD